MMDGWVLRRLWIERDQQIRASWEQIVTEASLALGESVDYCLGLYNAEGTLVATGSLDRNILKYLVVRPAYQAENLLTHVVMGLLERLNQEGWTNCFVYTKPVNLPYFKALGFRLLAQTKALLFLEQGFPSFEDYLSLLDQKRRAGHQNGAIVMNANPFTLGHRYLVDYALDRCDHLYLFVVSEDRSWFRTVDRLAMVQAGVADVDRVTVLPTRDYMVSQATFPSYFLKDQADLSLARLQAALDAHLFKEAIAPRLGIYRRFVGEEPYSPVTQVYNEALASAFGSAIDLQIVPRLRQGQEAISATRVRQALVQQDLSELEGLLPQTSLHYLTVHQLLGPRPNGEKVE